MKRVDRALEQSLDSVTDGTGRAERRRALAWYLTALLLEGGRKPLVAGHLPQLFRCAGLRGCDEVVRARIIGPLVQSSNRP
jgi:hypothetical protein